jgi:putative acetyltransferase
VAATHDPSVDLVIRAVREQDQDAVHAILTSPHVAAGSMRVPFAPLQLTRDRLVPRAGRYQLAAEHGRQVVGFAELITHPEEPRYGHAGDINMIATHAEWGRRGIGRALTEALVDLADNWLNITRLSLIVFTGNAHAVRLYESMGFEIEGTMRRVSYGAGAWLDAYMMARLRDPA